MSGLSRLSVVLLAALLANGSLSACVDRDLPANIIEDLNHNSNLLTLNLRFEFPFPQPTYLASVTEVEVEVYTRGRNQPVRDRFPLTITETTTDLQRSLSRVPGGQLEARIRLLQADGTPVQSLTQTWDSQDTASTLLITLAETPVILVSAQLDGQADSASLQSQQASLQQELNSLQQSESRLQSELRLYASLTLEDQLRRENLQVQLQANQNRQQQVQTELTNIKAQLTRLEAQGTGSSPDNTAALELELSTLRTQISQAQAEIGRLLERRSRLTAQLNAQFDDHQLREQWQAELEQVNTNLEQQTTELEGLAADLKTLDARLQGQNAGNPPDNTALLALEAQIAQKEAEIARIEADIQIWMESEDAIAITRRDQLQLELQAQRAELTLLEQRYQRLR